MVSYFCHQDIQLQINLLNKFKAFDLVDLQLVTDRLVICVSTSPALTTLL